MPSAAEFATALAQLPSRQAALLLRAARQSPTALADTYGVQPEAIALTLHAALAALTAHLSGSATPTSSAGDERAQADACVQAITHGTPHPLADLLRGLAVELADVEQRLDALRRAQLAALAPRERWLRRAFLVLVAVAAVLYVQHEGPGWWARLTALRAR